MILPILSLGHPALRKPSLPVPSDYPNMSQLIEDMWETMYNASGVGLAAVQVGIPIALFVVDSTLFFASDPDRFPDFPGYKGVFVNPKIVALEGPDCSLEEGCLSIPTLRAKVSRKSIVTVHFQDAEFQGHTQTFEGITARVILHEFDHTRGKLFVDYMSGLHKKIAASKLRKIQNGQVETDYPMRHSS